MRQLAFFLLIFTSVSSYGQDKINEIPGSDFKRVRVGINISPDICFRTLKNNDGSSTGDRSMKLRNEIEILKIGYTTGLNVYFNIKKNVSIETGIQYSNKGYQTKMLDLIYGQPEPASPSKSKIIYNFHYIDMPVKANFSIGKNNVRFFTSVGFISNIYIKETQTNIIVYSDRTDRKTNSTNLNYNRVNISPTISAGIDYIINSRMNLRIEPTFRYGVLKIIDAPMTGYLWNAGLNIGYYFEI